MKTSQIFALGLLFSGTLLSSVSAQAACYYNDPTVFLSIRSPGSSADVEIGVARISVSVSEGSLRSGSSIGCNNSSNSTTSIYVDNRYLGNNFVNFNTAEVADGEHTIRVQTSDNNGGSSSTSQRITVRNNWIRPEVYNQGDYLALNPDVLGAYGGDAGRTLQHWLLFGVREGRQANLTFATREYLENHGDLAAAFGADFPRAIDHYILFGINEGRVGVFSLRSEVFNVDYYYAMNGDLQAAFGPNVNALKRHWLEYGVNEGRRGNDSFSPRTYMDRYGDLQAAFGGGNYRAGIKHYLQYGRGEGRSGN